jgi:hypothetical protein
LQATALGQAEKNPVRHCGTISSDQIVARCSVDAARNKHERIIAMLRSSAEPVCSCQVLHIRSIPGIFLFVAAQEQNPPAIASSFETADVPCRKTTRSSSV